MSRILPVSIVLLALAMVLPIPVRADTPLENHVISRDAYAVFTTESACSTVTVFVNSSTNMFVPAHGDGGGAVKQGLTSLAILVEDTCAAAGAISVLAGGGGGEGKNRWTSQARHHAAHRRFLSSTALCSRAAG